MNQRLVLWLVPAITLFMSGCSVDSANPQSAGAQTITNVTIPVTIPVINNIPVTTIDNMQYTGTISWNPNDSPFAASTVYTAHITLSAKPGWTFSGVRARAFWINGAKTVSNEADSGKIDAVFPATKLVADSMVTQRDIPGIVPPVRGAIPITTMISTSQYSGIITWNPNHSPFAAGSGYTAYIQLTPKDGWTLTGVPEYYFRVAGTIMIWNAADSGIVVATFPATDTAISTNDYNSFYLGVMKYIPAGTFSRDGVSGNNSTVSAFRMGKYEITRAQYIAVTGAADPSMTDVSSGMNDPVQMVTWFDAVEFCNKLSVKEGLEPVYSISNRFPPNGNSIISATVEIADWNASGYRLPTEMEWMWAAMGATEGTTGYSNAFSGSSGTNSLGDYAVFGYYESTKNNGQTTTERSNPVGSKTTGANELGLYDISGNVWEWMWDLNKPWPTGELTDYPGASFGTYRIACGGSWMDNASLFAFGLHYGALPDMPGSAIGFRVVRR